MSQTVLITGAGGFIGASIASLLAGRPGNRVILTDRGMHPRIEALRTTTEFVRADLTNADDCRRVITPEITTIYHMAAMVSGGAEANFEAGFAINVMAIIHLLEACRRAGRCPRVVFTSTIASFGGAGLPQTVDDFTCQHPQNSYGVAKVIGEQLLNDYSRRGFVDGRGVRLAATVVRDDPHAGLSCCTSALVREPVAGRDYVCPLPPEERMPILSIGRTVDMLVRLGDIDGSVLGDFRTINGPSLSPTMSEIAEAVRTSGAAGLGSTRFEVDPKAAAVVATWPKYMRAERAARLGLAADESIERIVRDYVQTACVSVRESLAEQKAQ